MSNTDTFTKDKAQNGNEVQLIKEQEVLGKTLRVYGTVEEPLFVAKDVAEWIEYNTSSINKMLANVDDDEKVRKNIPTLGGSQESWLLTEDGLYEVLMQSRKPIAKEIKKEIKKILKTIRLTGGYISNAEMMVNVYFSDISEEQKIIIQGLLTGIEKKQKKILALSEENAVMKPKAEYFDELVDRNLLTNFRDTAKELGVKQNFFVKWLIEHKYVYRDSKKDLKPYASPKTAGLFELKEFSSRHSDHTGMQTLITPKGRETFRLLLKVS